MVKCSKTFSLIFDPEALEELISDYNKILLLEKESKKGDIEV